MTVIYRPGGVDYGYPGGGYNQQGYGYGAQKPDWGNVFLSTFLSMGLQGLATAGAIAGTGKIHEDNPAYPNNNDGYQAYYRPPVRAGGGCFGAYNRGYDDRLYYPGAYGRDRWDTTQSAYVQNARLDGQYDTKNNLFTGLIQGIGSLFG